MEESASSPLEEDDSVVSGGDSVSLVSESELDFSLRPTYECRLTPYGRYTKQDVIDQLETFGLWQWIICDEGNILDLREYHFHIWFEIEPGTAEETEAETDKMIKNTFRQMVYGWWPKEARFKGWGNAQWHFARCRDPLKAIRYTVKGRSYVHSATFSRYLLQHALSTCFSKKDIVGFRKEFKKLMDKYSQRDFHIPVEDHIRLFMLDFNDLKAKYGQMIVVQHAYGYALSTLVARDPSANYRIVDNFLARQ